MLIKEFLPNPEGKDTLGEYITLLNNGENPVNLTGWKIKDKSGKTFNLSGYELKPKEELKLPYSKTKITLNNNGEVLELLDNKGKLADTLSYVGQAKSGLIIKRIKEITPEIRKEFLEDFPTQFKTNISDSSFSSFWLPLMLIGIVLAVISLWIIKKISE